MLPAILLSLLLENELNVKADLRSSYSLHETLYGVRYFS